MIAGAKEWTKAVRGYQEAQSVRKKNIQKEVKEVATFGEIDLRSATYDRLLMLRRKPELL